MMTLRGSGCVLKLAVFAGLLRVMTAQAMEHQHGDATADPPLPEAPEKTEVMKFCTICHGIERIQHSGGTDVIWQDRIQRMVRWGAQIPQGRITSVASYLAQALPLRPRPAASLTYFANTAVREAIVTDIQRTVRVAARPDSEGQLRVAVGAESGVYLAVGQRARVFSVGARSTMIPATILRLDRRQDEYEAMLQPARSLISAEGASFGYLAEIVINSGPFLAIPNDAIIDDGSQRRVYVQDEAGEYSPRAVELGIQGDQMTQVLAGLDLGEQVVTLGSFFIDAEQQMNRGR